MIELTIAVVMALLLVCFLIEVLASSHRYVLEHLAVLCFGMVVGLAACILGEEEGTVHRRIYFLEFSEKVFFMCLAPPIFLEAGYSLNRHMFFNNSASIVLLGVVATYVQVMLFATCLYFTLNYVWSCDLDVPINFHQCVRLGAIFSTSDATALLRIFNSILPEHLQHHLADMSGSTTTGMLTSVAIGESLANNGVCVALFWRMGASSKNLETLVVVPFVFVLSSVAGLSVASVCTMITKHLDINKEPQIDFLLSIGFALLSYFLFVEVTYINELVSLYSCGFAMAHYNFKNLSTKAKVTAKAMIKSSSWASFTFIYFQMGIVFSVSVYAERPFWSRALPLMSLVLILMLFCRAFVVALGCGTLSAFKSDTNLGWREQVILNLSGVRGAVSYALCLLWRGKKLKSSLVTTTTLGIVIFTNLVLGSAICPMITLLFPDYRSDASTILSYAPEKRHRKSTMGSVRQSNQKHNR